MVSNVRLRPTTQTPRTTTKFALRPKWIRPANLCLRTGAPRFARR